MRSTRRLLRTAWHRLERRLHWLEGRWKGLRYRMSGRQPDPDVPDAVLEQRIRSMLGPVEKELDTPRVHVSVEGGLAYLHGRVPDRRTHDRIVAATLTVPGVTGVESFLETFLTRGYTRPSDGRSRQQPSTGRVRLVEAAQAAGAAQPEQAIRAVLGTLMARIPKGERRHVEGHLPADVRVFTSPPVRSGARVHDIREFVEVVQTTGGLYGAAEPERVVAAVVATLRELVPDEAADVGAVLPADLRAFWQDARA